MKILDRFFNSRFWALVQKEIRQILRNKQLIILLIVPPTVQLLLYGFALNPEIHHLSLGVMDYANVPESRELVAALSENQTFIVREYATTETQLSRQVEQGKLTVGLVIPPEFRRKLAQGKSAEVQVLIDGVDANSAGIASGYLSQIIQQHNHSLASPPIGPPIKTETIFLYSPGLRSSWFFVPGVMGLVLTLIATLTSSITVVKEKDTGTLEQLLMTPAEAWEILVAKILPLFFLLMGDVLLALTLGRLVFNLPFLGSFPLFMVLSGLYLFVGISIGIMLATISQSQQQVVLTTFFINLPMVQTSGAIAPIETMPPFFQIISLLNPLRHYVKIVRGVLLKGNGLDVLYPEALTLLVFAIVLLTLSSNKFRNQLS